MKDDKKEDDSAKKYTNIKIGLSKADYWQTEQHLNSQATLILSDPKLYDGMLAIKDKYSIPTLSNEEVARKKQAINVDSHDRELVNSVMKEKGWSSKRENVAKAENLLKGEITDLLHERGVHEDWAEIVKYFLLYEYTPLLNRNHRTDSIDARIDKEGVLTVKVMPYARVADVKKSLKEIGDQWSKYAGDGGGLGFKQNAERDAEWIRAVERTGSKSDIYTHSHGLDEQSVDRAIRESKKYRDEIKSRTPFLK